MQNYWPTWDFECTCQVRTVMLKQSLVCDSCFVTLSQGPKSSLNKGLISNSQ